MIILCLLLLPVFESYAFQCTSLHNIRSEEIEFQEIRHHIAQEHKDISEKILADEVTYIPKNKSTILNFLATSYTNIQNTKKSCSLPIIWSPEHSDLFFISGDLGEQKIAQIYNALTNYSYQKNLSDCDFKSRFLVPMTASPYIYVAFAEDERGEIFIWDILRDKIAYRIIDSSPSGITQIAWAPTGYNFLIASTHEDGSLRICNIETKESQIIDKEYPLQCTSPFRSLAWSKFGHFVAAGTNSGKIYMHDITKNVTTRYHMRDRFNISFLAWSPDTTKIAFIAELKNVYIFDLIHKKVYCILENDCDIEALRWYRPDELGIISNDAKLHIWNDTQRSCHSYALHAANLSFDWPSWSPDGRKLAFVSDKLLYTQNVPPLSMLKLNAAQIAVIETIIANKSLESLTMGEKETYQTLCNEWKELLTEHCKITISKILASGLGIIKHLIQ